MKYAIVLIKMKTLLKENNLIIYIYNMTSKLSSIDDLDCLTLYGLKEICKYNRLFSGYGNSHRITIIKNLDELLKNDITVFVPDLEKKFYKVKYVGKDVDKDENIDIDKEIKKKWKKDDPCYEKNRKLHLIDLTKKRYANDESFKKKMQETSKKYYYELKEAKKVFDEIKKKI